MNAAFYTLEQLDALIAKRERIRVTLSMSPPFVPVVASTLKNRDIILPGMIIGLIGYAVGNYLGVGLGHLIKTFG